MSPSLLGQSPQVAPVLSRNGPVSVHRLVNRSHLHSAHAAGSRDAVLERPPGWTPQPQFPLQPSSYHVTDDSQLHLEFSKRKNRVLPSTLLTSLRAPSPSAPAEPHNLTPPGCSPPTSPQQHALAQPLVLRVTTEEKPQRTRNQERSPDYFANVGDAIRTLREDIPELFQRELNYSIYRDDIHFKDPRFQFEGIKNYKLIFWSLRFHGRIFFSNLYVEIKRIWQPSDDVIKMRWTVHGIPRVPWEAEGIFDGISTYKLDNNGRIYEHIVDNILLRDPPFMTNPPLLAGLNLTPNTGLVPQQQLPCPGAWYMPTPVTGMPTQPDLLPARSAGDGHQLPIWHTSSTSAADRVNTSQVISNSSGGIDSGMEVLSRAAPLAGLQDFHLPPLQPAQPAAHSVPNACPQEHSTMLQAPCAAYLSHAPKPGSTVAAAATPRRQRATVSKQSSTTTSVASSSLLHGTYLSWLAPSQDAVPVAVAGINPQSAWSQYLSWVRLREALTASGLPSQVVGSDEATGRRLEPSPSR